MSPIPPPGRRLEYLLDAVRTRSDAGTAPLSDAEYNEVLRLICLRPLDDVSVEEVHLHVTSRVSGTVIVTATGRDWAGRLHPLGVVAGEALTADLASTLLLSMKGRGLASPATVTSNAPVAFGAAVETAFPAARFVDPAEPADVLSSLDLERLGQGDLASVLSPVPGQPGPSRPDAAD